MRVAGRGDHHCSESGIVEQAFEVTGNLYATIFARYIFKTGAVYIADRCQRTKLSKIANQVLTPVTASYNRYLW
jgi:hypothetical protein